MANFSRSELLELFFQEVKSYIPEMEHALSAVRSSKDRQAVGELHRLFHNIKGAAAQVQLSSLSRGARIVEDYLEAIVERGAPIIVSGIDSVKKTIELLDVFVESESLDPAVEEKFYKVVEGLVWPNAEDDVPDSEDETLETIRSLLPLLNELAACLGNDETHRKQNRHVFIKLSSAFATLAGVAKASEGEGGKLLFQDFSGLLGSLAEGGNSHQDEVTALVRDFLGFLQVAFSDNHDDRTDSLKRIYKQLKQVTVLLLSGETIFVDVASPVEEPFVDELFGDPENINDSISFLDELSDVEFSTSQKREQKDETDLFDFFEGDQGSSADDDFFAEEESTGELVESGLVNVADENTVVFPVDPEEAALAEIFKEECEEHFITINASLTHLEKQVAIDASDRPKIIESLTEIRRAVHTLKGAASMTGVNLLAGAAHTLEDMLDWLYDHDELVGRQEVQLIGESAGTLEKLAGHPDNDTALKLQENIERYLGEKSKATVEEEDVVVEEDVIGMLAEAEHGVQESPILPEDSGTLRVRLDDLDELLSVEGELVVARGAIEKMVEEVSETLGDLENVKENLRRKSQELESGFEVQALYGVKPLPSGSAGPLMHFDEHGGQELSEFDPIELDRYSELNLIIRSLNEISVDVNSIYSTLQSLTGNISGQVAKQQLTMRQMQDKLMRIRMTPLSAISRVLYSTVRNASAKLEKPVDLNIVGEDVYMDRFVWAKVTDPLLHILRNSVDHGIESTDRRRLAGKQDRGRITLRAEQRSRYVVLYISDDGAGIDLNLLRERLSTSSIVNNPEKLSDSEVLEYIFYPSVSTKKEITELSGRGVGLDVVKKNIQDLRGSIQVDNSPGQGVKFEIHIPFTLSVNRAVLVNVAGNSFAVPLQDIEEIRQFKVEDIRDEDGALSILVKDEFVTFSSLASYLELEDNSARTSGAAILFSATPKSGEASRSFVLSVTEIIEQREIIVKGLGSHLTHVQGIGGVTVSGGGDLIPILNLRELVDVQPQVRHLLPEAEVLPIRSEPLKVLIVDDSISVRYSIARLVESQGWTQQQAVDGLEALVRLENFTPDVIILDIEMPKMNGYEFKSNINNRDAYKDIPVIMLTSRASEKHQVKAKELGVAYYMTKPYEEDSFVQLLEQIEAKRNERGW
ncbi:MAG: chemosensory pili system protein ChpA (sensor histidine kinase/response regulator) [Desulforhopalus sp.]|jgi:chemosensory pili system protein ChpA (sensor histidine kinase/response regulator)